MEPAASYGAQNSKGAEGGEAGVGEIAVLIRTTEA